MSFYGCISPQTNFYSLTYSFSSSQVVVSDDTRHGLEEGDHVIFVEIGPKKLATTTPAKVTKCSDPYSFVCDASEFPAGFEASSGSVTQVGCFCFHFFNFVST
jgi:hypothetical protein